MSTSFKRLGQSELLPRYIFAESLYARRRVLEIGAVASTLGQSARFLATRGARVVVAADSDLQAIQDAQAKLAGPNLRFRPPVFDDFEAGSFDLVMVADLAPYVLAPELLKDLARLVAKTGYLMGGLRNPAGLALANVVDPEEADAPPTYGQLLDALSAHFSSVEVATQSPVLGYQLAFERGDGLQVDGTLAGSSEAAYFIVIAGQEPARTFDPTWVQLPPEPLAFTGGKLEDYSTRARDWRERSLKLKDALEKKTAELQTRVADLHETTQQLEGAKEAVARLTAQLESQREKPESLRDREELAQRVRRLDAELTVLRERAIDAEGRATAARNEHEALQRAQKDAAIGALAAQEQIRLERARREEVATQLEDARTRLARAYEALKTAQEDVVTERIERERALGQVDRVREEIASRDTELAGARARELALADARTQSLQAIEGLERSLAEARQQVAAMREEANAREADRSSLARSFEVESTQRRELERDVQRANATIQQLQTELDDRRATLTGLETELQAASSAHARTLRDIETLASSERTWRDLAQQYEQRIAETNANVQQLSDQIAQLSAEKDAEIARAHRLQRDLETAITAERTSREQADVVGGGLRQQITELTQDRDRLIDERDDLRGAVEDLRKARQSEQQRGAQLEDERATLTANVQRLEGELAQTRREHEALVQSADHQRRALEGVLADRETTLGTERATAEALRQQIVGLDSEVARLGGLLRDGQRTLDETRATLEARGADVETEREALRASRERIQTLEQTLATATEALEQTSDTLAATRSEKNALQARLDETTKRATGLSEQVQNLQRVTLAADEAIAATKAQRNALDRELNELRTRFEAERKQFEGRYQGLEATATLSAERATELERRVAQLTHDLRIAQEQAAEREAADAAKLEQATAELSRAREEREHLASESSRLGGDVEQLTQRATAATLELDELREALERRTASFNEAQAALHRATEALDDRERSIEVLSTERAHLAQSADQHLGKALSLETALLSAQEQLKQLTSSLEERNLEAGQLRATLGEKGDLVEQLRSEHATALAELEAKHGAMLDEHRATVAHLTASHATTLDEHTAQAARRLQEHEAALAALVSERDRLASEVAALRSQAQASSEELEHVKAELEEGALARTEEQQLREAAVSERTRLADALSTLTDEHRALAETLRRTTSEWEEAKAALLETHRRELEARSEAATRALDARQAELEAQLLAVRLEHQKALESQAEAYRQNLEQKGAEAAKALAAREDELLQRVGAAEARANESDRQRQSVDASLQQAVVDADRERTEHQTKLETLRDQLAETSLQLEKAHSEARGHQLGKHALQEELDRSRVELDQLRTSLAQAGGESRAIAEARAQLEAEVERLRQRVPSLESELEQLRGTQGELSTLRARVPTLELSINEITEKANALETAKATTEASSAVAQNELTAAQGRLHLLEAAKLELDAKVHALQQELIEAESRAVQLGESLSQFQDERPALNTEIVELRLRANVLEKQLAEAQRTAPRTDAEVERLGRRVPELEAELEIARTNAKNDVEAATQARRQAEELLLALRVKYGDLQHELTRVNELLETSKRDAPDVREEVAELKTENEILEAERERLSDVVATLELRVKEQNALKDRLFRVETDLELTRKLLTQSRRELDEAKKAQPPPPLPPRSSKSAVQPEAPATTDFDEDPITAVTSIPSLAALLKQTAPTTNAPPKSPPPAVPPTAPEEVYELDVPDDGAEEIVLLDEETGDDGKNGGNGDGKK